MPLAIFDKCLSFFFFYSYLAPLNEYYISILIYSSYILEVYMILVTGGAGFIGSNLVNELLKVKLNVVVCDFRKKIKKNYFSQVENIFQFIEPKDLENFIIQNEISVIFHLGAISSTTFHDANQIWFNNIFTSKKIWELCCRQKIRLIYASSAATYGNGDKGYIDIKIFLFKIS